MTATTASGRTGDVTGPDETPLRELAAALRTNPSLLAKAGIGLVSEVFAATDWLRGPGDDGAGVPIADTTAIACGEAMWPPFVRADPYGAGIAAVLANVNDLAAMGAIPLGIVDTIVADRPLATRVLEGMRFACELYDVPLLGGHLTQHDGEPAVSAFGLGRADRPLSVLRAEPGQRLVVACATEGDMREDFPFFRSFGERADQCAGDVRLLAHVAATGACVAAKDISMAGLVGSLAMLLEHGRLGVTVDLDRLPMPSGVELSRWLQCFPSFGFLLCVPAGREQDAIAPFAARGLHAAVVGDLDDTGEVALLRAGERAVVVDVGREPVTGLRRGPADAPARS